MHPPGVQSLKLLLTFAFATGGAVLLAVQLHQGGAVRAEIVAESPVMQAPPIVQSTEPPLPIFRDTAAIAVTPEAQPEPVAAIPVAEPVAVANHVAEPVADEAPAVEAAPAPAPQATAEAASSVNQSLPVAEAKPMEVAMLVTPPSYEPFKTPLSEILRHELPKAVPIPLVYQAVVMNDNEWLRQLLHDGYAVNDTTPFGDTALCAAVKARNQDAIEQLLLHGADPEIPGRDGQTPLALACLFRTVRGIPVLLEAGADPNTTYQAPVSAELLKKVPYPDLKESLESDRGVTVLMAVAARGDAEGMIALLQHGAKPEQSTKRYYRYPINYAAEQQYIFLMRILLGRSPDSEPDVLVTVDLSQQRATLMKEGQIVGKTDVSTGREGYDTPEGRYLVTDKHSSWTSTIYHVEMPWFMRLNCSAIGLHAGYVTGEPASHGCIRLPYEVARKWFSIVKVGDEVQVVR